MITVQWSEMHGDRVVDIRHSAGHLTRMMPKDKCSPMRIRKLLEAGCNVEVGRTYHDGEPVYCVHLSDKKWGEEKLVPYGGASDQYGKINAGQDARLLTRIMDAEHATK